MTTKTFNDLRIGDKLQNNDPRKNGETITITDIHRGLSDRVEYKAASRTATVKKERIFFDGKRRSQGYNYVEPKDAPTAIVQPAERAFTPGCQVTIDKGNNWHVPLTACGIPGTIVGKDADGAFTVQVGADVWSIGEYWLAHVKDTSGE